MPPEPPSERPQQPLFSDHRRHGKALIPPFVDRGWQALEFADTILPELIWIGFLQDRWGHRLGAELAIHLIKAALAVLNEDTKPEFGFATAHRVLTPAHRATLLQQLDRDGVLPGLREGLRAFLRSYSDNNPLDYLNDPSPQLSTPDDITSAKRVIKSRLNRWSGEATAMQAVVVKGELVTGRLHMPSDAQPPLDFDAVFDSPESASAKDSGGYLRTMVSGSYSYHRPILDSTWWTYFWRRGYALESIPDHLPLPPPANTSDHVLVRFRVDFARAALTRFRELSTPVILAASAEEEHAVVNGLLARQVTLATSLADNFETWNWEIGPLYLRAMTDCYITLAWILGDLPQRARDYVMAGLGQEKLQIGHKERALASMTDPEARAEYQEVIDISKHWIDGQKFLFWVPVNTGSWSGKSTRQMAEEAGCLDLYNHVYLPCSSVAHSMWNHVGKMNSIPKPSPLHQNLRLPHVPRGAGEADIPYNAAKYLEKSFAKVAEKFGLKLSEPSLQDWVGQTLEEVMKRLERDYDRFQRTQT